MAFRELRWSLRNAGRPDCFGYVVDSTTAAQYPRFEVVVECEDQHFAHETHYNLAPAERRLAALYAILTGQGWEPCST